METKLTGHVVLERKLNCFVRLTPAIVLAKDYTGFRNQGESVKEEYNDEKLATKLKLCKIRNKLWKLELFRFTFLMVFAFSLIFKKA